MPEPPPESEHHPILRPLARRFRSFSAEVTTQLLSLATSALGLVAALAWNDAVQAVFKEYFPAGSGITAKFLYAILVSLLILVVTLNLTRLAAVAKNGKTRQETSGIG